MLFRSLVGNELGSREGHCHAEGGRIGEVECLETLGSVKGFGALHQGLVDGAVDLHSLLDNCLEKVISSIQEMPGITKSPTIEWVHQRITCNCGRGTTESYQPQIVSHLYTNTILGF